jgi:hypothetical protein
MPEFSETVFGNMTLSEPTKEPRAAIHLSNLRIRFENGGCTSIRTFNSHQPRLPFYSLFLLNDNTLAPRAKEKYVASESCTIVVLPIVGGIDLIENSESNFLEAGGCKAISLKEHEPLFISNPYQTESVNYLIVGFSGASICNSHKHFDLMDETIKFHKIFQSPSSKGSVAMLKGREDREYFTSEGTKGFYTFVIQGAFEFENRLIERGDGLAINNQAKAVFEALSQNAIILILELI